MINLPSNEKENYEWNRLKRNLHITHARDDTQKLGIYNLRFGREVWANDMILVLADLFLILKAIRVNRAPR